MVGLVTTIIGVIVGYHITKSGCKELRVSVNYWRHQYEQSCRDANCIADEYENIKKRYEAALKLLPQEYRIMS